MTFDRQRHLDAIASMTTSIEGITRSRAETAMEFQRSCPHDGGALEMPSDEVGWPPEDAETILPRRTCLQCGFEEEGAPTGFAEVYGFKILGHCQPIEHEDMMYYDRRHKLLGSLGLSFLVPR